MKNKLKHIFSIGIFVFTMYKLKQELSGTNFYQVYKLIQNKPDLSIVALVIIGAIGVLLVCLYDLVLVRSQKLPVPVLKTLKMSWITNSLNDLIGFGGIIGASIRYNYYKNFTHNKEEQRELKLSISLLLASMLTGISALSALVLFKVLKPTSLLQERPVLGIIMPILVVFLPIFLIINYLKPAVKKDRFLAAKYTLISTIDNLYAGVIMFCCLRFVGISVDFGKMESLFIISTVAGVISMIPGGLGAFDLLFLLGMNIEFKSQEDLVLLALICYRIVYYILPFLLGILLSVTEFQTLFGGGKDKTKRFIVIGREMGKIFMSVTKHRLEAIMRVIFTIAFSIMTFFYIQDSALSFLINYRSHSPLIYTLCSSIYVISAIMLIPQLLGILYGSLEAYALVWLQLTVIFITQLINYVNDQYLLGLFISVGALVMLLFYKNFIVVNVLPRSGSEIFIWFGTIIVLCYNFVFTGENLGSNYNLSLKYVDLTLSIVLVVWLVFIISLRWYIRLSASFEKEAGKINLSSDKQIFKEILEKFRGGNLAHLGFLSDNKVISNQSQTSSIIYQENMRVVVVLGDPLGEKSATFDFLQEIENLVKKTGKQIVYYQTSTKNIHMYNELNYKLFNLGEEGEVDLTSFKISGNKGKVFRQLLNKQEKNELSFQIETPTSSVISELKTVSDAWLEGKEEMSFSLGGFDEAYIRQSDVATIREKDGEIIAFATLMPIYIEGKLSVDLIRWLPHEEIDMMDLLYLQVMLWAKEEGYQSFNIGMAPLSNSYERTNNFINAAKNSIYQYSNSFYSFKGLRHYKNKFKPEWSPRYLIYPKKLGAIDALYQSYRIIHPKEKKAPFWKKSAAIKD